MASRTLVLLTLLLLPVLSQADIYKCLVNGKVIYTDQECPDNQVSDFKITDLNSGGATEITYTGSIWFKDSSGYARAIEAGKKENLPVLIYGYTDWCGFCKRLEKNYFTHHEVNKSLGRFIKVKLNPEHSAKDKQLFQSLGGTGYPTLFVQHPNQPLVRISTPFTKQKTDLSPGEFNKRFLPHLMPYEKVVAENNAQECPVIALIAATITAIVIIFGTRAGKNEFWTYLAILIAKAMAKT